MAMTQDQINVGLFDEVKKLQQENARLKEREKLCETMDEAEKLALLRALQEIRDEVGLFGDGVSPRQIVEEVRVRLSNASAEQPGPTNHPWLTRHMEISNENKKIARYASALKVTAIGCCAIFVVGVPVTGFLMHPVLGCAFTTAMAFVCARAAMSCVADLEEKDSSHNDRDRARRPQQPELPQKTMTPEEIKKDRDKWEAHALQLEEEMMRLRKEITTRQENNFGLHRRNVRLAEALRGIADFVPPNNASEPYQSIAVHVQNTARRALDSQNDQGQLRREEKA